MGGTGASRADEGVRPTSTNISAVPKYQRIVLKLSGEALAGGGSFGVDPERVKSLAAEIGEVGKTGV